jgi:hypothetical protein
MPTGYERSNDGKTCECGVPNAESANFCTSCGKPLLATDVSDAAASPVESVDAAAVNAQRQKRILKVAGSFIAIVLVVAIGLTYFLQNVHIVIKTNNATVALTLNVCQTSVGALNGTPVNLPSTIPAKIPAADTTKLAFYSDNEGLIKVLAPIGWSCNATITASGASWVDVSPAAQTVLGSGVLPAGSTAQEITASQSSACVGCRETLACPLFVAAANAYQSTFGQACPSSRPSSEVVTNVNEHLVEFTDPPNLHGDADPSGGAYPALGVMTYYGDQNTDGSWKETCVLPPTSTAMCTAIIANFESNYAKR